MGLLHKDLQERNVVYDELIKHFKEKIVSDNKKTNKNEWLMETYDNEVKKADNGDAYLYEKLLANGFGGLAAGLISGGIILNEPAILAASFSGAIASTGISLYYYLKFKRMSLGRGLGTRMYYAETLQKIIEENSFKYPFNSGEMEDYDNVVAYMDLIKQLNTNDNENEL